MSVAKIDEAELVKMPWYLKGSRQQAEAMLANEDAGSFVVRPSSQANCLALSHKVSSGAVGHALIHSTPQGFRLEQTQNAFPSLELLVLSIKKHFTVSDSLSGLGAALNASAGAAAAGGGGGGGGGKKAAAKGGDTRLSSNDPNRTVNMAQLGEMFPSESRESLVTAMQLANGDATKAADLMLQGELHSSDDAAEARSIVRQAIPQLLPRIERVRDAVQRIGTYQELKQKVALGKAVAEVKKTLVPFEARGAKRSKPADLPPGPPGTTEEQLVRFKNTINHSVWEVLSKLDTMAKDAAAPASGGANANGMLQVVGAISQTLGEVEPLLGAAATSAPGSPSPGGGGGGGGGGASASNGADGGGGGDDDEQQPRRGPRSDEEFYIDYNEIVIDSEIGKGAYGKVYKGKFRGRVVAIKTIEVKDEKELVLIRREISLLRECLHPNITELIGVSKDGDALLLVMEYVDRGELYKLLLDEAIEIDWQLRLKIATDVASGLAHVHSKNLIHRDIKSENLLVDSKWNVKLCDFGFARAVSHGMHRYTMCGSMYFNAPELLLGKPYDAKADVFAYGIFLCELITRGSINLERTKQTAFGLDVKSLEQHIPKDCPPLFWKVAFCCCTYNPARRPSMAQVSKMLVKIRAKTEG